MRGKHAKKKFGGQTLLSEEEEVTFSKYCITMSSFGFPVDTWDLRCIVKSYLDRQGRVVKQFKNNLPGKEWTISFLKRHEQLTVRFASNIKRKRAEISADTINEFFSNLSAELVDIPPTHIWNYDETNLTDDPGNKRVITKRGTKYPERIINSTKTATSLRCSVGTPKVRLFHHMSCIRPSRCDLHGRKMDQSEQGTTDRRAAGMIPSALRTGLEVCCCHS